MAEDYEAQQGDCINSIAYNNGFFWKTIWNHASNSDLKTRRKDPNVLLEGDIVHIPDLTPRQESGATEERHRFKLRGVPVKLKIRFLRGGSPRADEAYRLELDDGKVLHGSTDDNGWLEESIPPLAKWGRLFLGRDTHAYALEFGCLDPIDAVTGVQSRLNALGYGCGEVDGLAGPRTQAAIRQFQERNGLKADGIAGPQTQAKLKSVFGC